MTDDQTASIACRSLAVGYDGDPVLEQITLAVEPGETLAIVGTSGSGKTTLLKTLAGIIEPIAGEATVLGERRPGAPPAGALGYIPQSLGLVPHASVMRNVLHGTLADQHPLNALLGRFSPDAEKAAFDAIDRVGLAGLERRRVKELSGGQQRRVAIARAIVQRPQVLLADEMLSELDGETARSIIDRLAALQADTHMSVVVVEHDLGVADELGDRVFRTHGETLVEAPPARAAPTNHQRVSP